MAVDFVLAERIVEYLNALVAIDPDCISWLMNVRVVCNDALANHPTVQVGHYTLTGDVRVGFLGLLNGLCGADDETQRGGIIMEMEEGGSVKTFYTVLSVPETQKEPSPPLIA